MNQDSTVQLEKDLALTPPVQTGYVREIDALRAFAAFAVILQHCGLLPFGWMGVWLFFVISGFAITSSLTKSTEKSSKKSRSIVNFFARRSIRIWPVYFLYLALCVPVLLIFGDLQSLQSYPYLSLFVFNLKMIADPSWSANGVDSIIGHLWTISVEEQFYLFFPFLFLLLRPAKFQTILIGLVVLGPFIRFALSLLMAQTDWTDLQSAFSMYALSVAHFDAFALGALIAMQRDFISRNLGLARLVLTVGILITIVHCVVYVSLNAAAGAQGVDVFRNVISGILWGEGREIFVYSTVSITAAGLIMLILARDRFLLSVCNLPYLQFLGRISYGIYLYHALVLYLVNQALSLVGFGDSMFDDAIKFLIVSGITVLIAQASFKYFETPILKLRKRFP